MTLAVKAAVGGGSLLLAFMAGRLSVRPPAPPVPVAVKAERHEAKAATAATAANSTLHVKQEPVTTRWKFRPAPPPAPGAPCPQATLAEVEQTIGGVTTDAAAHQEVRTASLDLRAEKVAAEYHRDTWGVSAGASATLKGDDRRLSLRVDRRVLGPLGVYVGIAAGSLQLQDVRAEAGFRWGQ